MSRASADQPTSAQAFARHPRCVIVAHPSSVYARAFEQLSPSVRVVHCADCRALLCALDSHVPDLIVVELRLQDGPTTRIIAQLRERFAAARIVVVTSHGSIASAIRCLKLGIDGYYATGDGLDAVLSERTPEDSPPIPERPIRLERAIWEYLNRIVEQTGSITTAAGVLGLDRRSLRRMLGRYAPPR